MFRPNSKIEIISYDIESRELLQQLLKKKYQESKQLLALNQGLENTCFTNPGKLNMQIPGSNTSIVALSSETLHLHYFNTPIISLMASQGDKQAVELLISHGADINKKDYYGYTPVDYAISNGHLEIVKLLIAKGAEVRRSTMETGEIGSLVNAERGTPYKQREAFLQIKNYLSTLEPAAVTQNKIR